MTRREAILYHQVHPLKLATDISTAIASLVLLAEHRPWTALIVMFVPSIIVTAILIRFGDFTSTRDAPIGAYLRRYMTRTMEAVRFAGLALAAVAAYHHVWWLIPAGAAVIIAGWTAPWLLERGRADPQASRRR
jgi:hypothetical protein